MVSSVSDQIADELYEFEKCLKTETSKLYTRINTDRSKIKYLEFQLECLKNAHAETVRRIDKLESKEPILKKQDKPVQTHSSSCIFLSCFCSLVILVFATEFL